MAVLDFPNSPAVGDTFGSSGQVYRWNGSMWLSTAGPSGARGILGYAQITTPQTGITSITDITGLTSVINPVVGRRYKVTVEAQAYSSVVADFGSLQLWVGGAQVQSCPAYFDAINGQEKFTISYVFTATSTSALTFQVRYARAGGTGTHVLFCGPTFPAYIMSEDITFEAGTSGDNLSNPMPRGVIGYSQVVADQSGIASSVTVITGSTINWTAIAGRRYRFTFSGEIVQTVGTDVWVLNLEDTGSTLKRITGSNGGTASKSVEGSYINNTSISGAKTWRVNAIRAVGSGSLTIGAAATFPAYVIIEDIGAL